MCNLKFAAFFLVVFALVLIVGIGVSITKAFERALVGPLKTKGP